MFSFFKRIKKFILGEKPVDKTQDGDEREDSSFEFWGEIGGEPTVIGGHIRKVGSDTSDSKYEMTYVDINVKNEEPSKDERMSTYNQIILNGTHTKNIDKDREPDLEPSNESRGDYNFFINDGLFDSRKMVERTAELGKRVDKLEATLLYMARNMDLECGWTKNKDPVLPSNVWVIYDGILYSSGVSSNFRLDPDLETNDPQNGLDQRMPVRCLHELGEFLLNGNNSKNGFKYLTLTMAKKMGLECGWSKNPTITSLNHIWVIYDGVLYHSQISRKFELDPVLEVPDFDRDKRMVIRDLGELNRTFLDETNMENEYE